ncbi:uncharacterized protein LOC116507905 [Thamnophis elegans]|uniref:uncharacterized protein LOC116507905 n=1 Tax=Thamnophis elegans TaxID=35005 RepID=UPI001378F884|nr:uncharacterized protein LOC116507905 [Thamnophis elegans]
MGNSWPSGKPNVHEILVNHSSERNDEVGDIQDNSSTFLQKATKNDVQLPPKGTHLPDSLLIEDQKVHLSNIHATLHETLPNILKNRIDDFRIPHNQEDKSLSYTGTRALMQNVFKTVNHVHQEQSTQSDIKDENNVAETAILDNPFCIRANEHHPPPGIWLDNSSPDLLLDILKPDNSNHKNNGQHGIVSVKDQRSQVEIVSPLDQLLPSPDGAKDASELKSVASSRTHLQPVKLLFWKQISLRNYTIQEETFATIALEMKESFQDLWQQARYPVLCSPVLATQRT